MPGKALDIGAGNVEQGDMAGLSPLRELAQIKRVRLSASTSEVLR